MNIINAPIVLKLNKNWQALTQAQVGKTIVDMATGVVMAMDIHYTLDDDGSPVGEPTHFSPVSWEEWLKLPVRDFDLSVHYAGGNKIMRVPTVVIAQHFTKMPTKKFKAKPSKDGVYHRDGGIDQYTGKKLSREEMSIDHVIPKSKGGGDTWENWVTTSKEINSKKGDRLNSEVGLNLIRKPFKPNPIPLFALIKDAKHRDWEPFLIKNR
jgi:hypothetical protein